ncbi:MAG: hypothetical protein M5U34_41845 [Chloroflexi bacterium]|nr:hypothetical protein [Chloroflexota bacterium]
MDSERFSAPAQASIGCCGWISCLSHYLIAHPRHSWWETAVSIENPFAD